MCLLFCDVVGVEKFVLYVIRLVVSVLLCLVCVFRRVDVVCLCLLCTQLLL